MDKCAVEKEPCWAEVVWEILRTSPGDSFRFLLGGGEGLPIGRPHAFTAWFKVERERRGVEGGVRGLRRWRGPGLGVSSSVTLGMTLLFILSFCMASNSF